MELPGDGRNVDLSKLFTSIKNPASLTPLHVSALNLRVNSNISLDRLIPINQLPSLVWESDPASHGNVSGSSRLTNTVDKLCNGTCVPGHQAYYVRMRELLSDNEDVYRVVERRPMDPKLPSVKITHFRRFFQELHIVGEYWDTSLDGPSPQSDPGIITTIPAQNDVMNVDRQGSEGQPIRNDGIPKAATMINAQHVTSNLLHSTITTMSTDPSSSDPKCKQSSPSSITSLSNIQPSTSARGTYTSRRTSTGSRMPLVHRHNVLKEFLEPILWAFGCRCDIPRAQPYLLLRNLKIPIDLSSVVYSSPEKRPATVRGTLQGPLMGAQGRSETAFGEGDGQADIADLLREVGAMLLLAQQRAREGQEEIVPNADKWFVTRPRWGGGSGEAIGEVLAPSSVEEVANQEQRSDGVRGQTEEPPMKKRSFERRVRGEKGREAKKKEDLKKSVMPPVSMWDKRVKYMRIGKDAESNLDDVSGYRC